MILIKMFESYTTFPCPFLATPHPCLFILLLSLLLSQLERSKRSSKNVISANGIRFSKYHLLSRQTRSGISW